MSLRFASFELDPDRFELRQNGRLVHVEPRVLDLLTHLVRHRDRVVSKAELLDSIWKTRVVGEAALSRGIMQARKAISGGDGAAEAIKTVHRRGFRFMLPVTEHAAEVDVAASKAAPLLDAEAVKLCARALLLWKKRSPEAMRQAIVLLQSAIEIEPEYAQAYATLGDCYSFIGFLQQSPPDSVFPKAEAAIARALALDPDLPEAHACRGFIQTVYGWDPDAAGLACARALALDNQLAIGHHRLGLHLLARREFDAADAALRHASLLDPLSPILATACGLPAMGRGDPQSAIEVYRRVLESEPMFFPAHLYLGLALERLGHFDAAVDALQMAVAATPTETEALPALAHACARAGRAEEAGRIAERLRVAATQRFIPPFFFAVLAMALDDHETALRRLEDAVETRAMRMHDLHLDPRFAPLHAQPRFQSLLPRIGYDPDADRRQALERRS